MAAELKPLNPCKLRNLSDESQAAVASLLHAIYDKHEEFLGIVQDTGELSEVGQYTAIGLEIVLEALGVPGFEFT
jgi:hypothetical protein